MSAPLRRMSLRSLSPTVWEILWRLHYYYEIFRNLQGRSRRQCPICRYAGKFRAAGHPPRYDSECPECGSRERHRLLFLCDRQLGLFKPEQAVLHFAPEDCVSNFVKGKVRDYQTADITPGSAELQLDIENIPLPDGTADIVLVSHVLEHVDDRRALSEIFRILRPGGQLVAMVPVIEGWSATYENPLITDPAERELHFGQHDHVRYYGRDFVDRLRTAGFQINEFQALPADCVACGLSYGEKVYIGEKPASAARVMTPAPDP